ncbi:MAG: putative ribonucleotide transport ATP-binding protein mkl [Candidatus Anoxychlamydiales bacterium]|nr:putative ribonucleotide transport ATP-binding protein mkl [Candidatus Anoxychlamydiales bacterium]
MIKIKNLHKSFSNSHILKGVDLEVFNSEILVILGRSGSGKSVLLKHIMGLEKPDLGSIEINGVDITKLDQIQIYQEIKNMGMLFQGSALFDSMDIESNVSFYLMHNDDPTLNRKLNRDEIKKRVNEALSMVGLDGINKKNPSSLSGGMKKRVGLARLIAYRPKILLYDEPTTGLDPITAKQINDLIIKTQNELNGTSIIVTHDIYSAFSIADRIALHRDGKIIYIDTPTNFIKINDPDINFIKELLNTFPRGRK